MTANRNRIIKIPPHKNIINSITDKNRQRVNFQRTTKYSLQENFKCIVLQNQLLNGKPL